MVLLHMQARMKHIQAASNGSGTLLNDDTNRGGEVCVYTVILHTHNYSLHSVWLNPLLQYHSVLLGGANDACIIQRNG